MHWQLILGEIVPALFAGAIFLWRLLVVPKELRAALEQEETDTVLRLRERRAAERLRQFQQAQIDRRNRELARLTIHPIFPHDIADAVTSVNPAAPEVHPIPVIDSDSARKVRV